MIVWARDVNELPQHRPMPRFLTVVGSGRFAGRTPTCATLMETSLMQLRASKGSCPFFLVVDALSDQALSLAQKDTANQIDLRNEAVWGPCRLIVHLMLSTFKR